MRYITLRNTPTGWLANFHEDAELLALFGTTEIPTAYTAQATPAHVLERISDLNPLAVVEVAS